MFTNQVVSIRVGTSSSEFGSSEASGRATSVRNPWSCMAMGPCVLAAWPSWLFRTTPCLTVLICSSENSWPFLYEDDFPATELSFPMNFSRLCWKWECSRVPDKNKCIVLLFYIVLRLMPLLEHRCPNISWSIPRVRPIISPFNAIKYVKCLNPWGWWLKTH